MEKAKSLETLRSQQGMLLESNIELQIRDSLQIIDSQAFLFHVKGHQDDNSPMLIFHKLAGLVNYANIL